MKLQAFDTTLTQVTAQYIYLPTLQPAWNEPGTATTTNVGPLVALHGLNGQEMNFEDGVDALDITSQSLWR